MIVYLGVFLIILLLLNSRGYKKTSASQFRWLIVPFLLIFTMMALRVDWSGDYDSYEDMFAAYHSASYGDALEIGFIESGFRLLMVFCDSYRSLIVVTSLVICLCLFIFFNNLPKEYILVAFFLLFFDKALLPGEISGMRNGLAVAIFVIGLLFLQKGDKIRNRVIYVLFVLAAYYFHRSAIFLLVLVLIPTRQLNIKPSILIGLFIGYVIIAISAISLIGTELEAFISATDDFERFNSYVEGASQTKYSISLFYLPAIPMLYFIFQAMNTKGLTQKDYFFLNASLFWGLLIFFPSIAFKSRFHFYIDFLLMGGSCTLLAKVPKYRYPYLICLLVFYIADYIRYATSLHYLQHWFHYHSIIGL